MIKSLRKAKVHVKNDERILGDSDFVETVIKSDGFDMAKIADRVAELLCTDPELILQPGKQPQKVKAQSLFAC